MKAIVDHLAVEYAISGEGKTVLFLHGWGSSLKTFAGIIARVPHVQAVRLDLPGFGHSEIPQRAWDVAEYARFIQKFCDKIGIQPDIVVGHSLGGRIILKGVSEKLFAPEKVVLIASAGVAERNTSKNIFWEILAKTGAVFTAFLPQSAQESLRGALYTFLKSDYHTSGALRETFVNVISENLSEDARRVHVPALLIWGEKDDTTPVSEAHSLKSLIGRSELVVIKEAGHFVHETNAAEVASLIHGFI